MKTHTLLLTSILASTTIIFTLNACGKKSSSTSMPSQGEDTGDGGGGGGNTDQYGNTVVYSPSAGFVFPTAVNHDGGMGGDLDIGFCDLHGSRAVQWKSALQIVWTFVK
ncbi:MAG: hypothetical protein KF799_09475 [Bdellovibrionales bacterium]|nr:hypothetical protein [Bdellovibrionales bacterium]